jgi:two-component system, LuxR family, response regulator FixJ
VDSSSTADDVDTTAARVHVVDDDSLVRKAVTRLLRSAGYQASAFATAEEFLARTEVHMRGCVVLDVAMPGLGGLDVQQTLAERGHDMPVIFLTGRADVPICISAMKQGAFDFITKPFDEAELLAAVERALAKAAALERQRAQLATTNSRLATLTLREREVLGHVLAGRLNKQIAADLGAAEKTIKVHRARCMFKMQARSLAELVRMVERAHPEIADQFSRAH